jgi:hypothetical protein
VQHRARTSHYKERTSGVNCTHLKCSDNDAPTIFQLLMP